MFAVHPKEAEATAPPPNYDVGFISITWIHLSVAIDLMMALFDPGCPQQETRLGHLGTRHRFQPQLASRRSLGHS